MERSQEAADIASSKPAWGDYVSEGVIDHEPEPGADGMMDVPISNNHAAVVRAWEMNRESLIKEADYSQKHYDEKPRVEIRGRKGEKKRVLEHMAERADRKHWTPKTTLCLANLKPGWTWVCEQGHRFGFVRSTRRPERTFCPDCEGLALAEPSGV